MLLTKLISVMQAKTDVVSLFQALSEAERDALVGNKSAATKTSAASKAKAKAIDSDSSTTKIDKISATTPSTKTKKRALENVNCKTDTEDATPAKSSDSSRPKKQVDPEKAAKVSLFICNMTLRHSTDAI